MCASLCSAGAAARSTSGAASACCDALDERALALIADVGLSPYADALAAELPYGHKRALEIATTLALDPDNAAARRADRGHGP